jgi:hypothetical protein
MKIWNKMGLGIAAAVVASAMPAMAADYTVGQFLVEVAKAKNIVAVDAASAERGLRQAGVSLPALDLNKSLTEGTVASIATAVGVPVSTSRPDAPFNQGQVESFITTFGASMGSGSTNTTDAAGTDGTTKEDPQPGKGKSKGFNKSPSEPV